MVSMKCVYCVGEQLESSTWRSSQRWPINHA